MPATRWSDGQQIQALAGPQRHLPSPRAVRDRPAGWYSIPPACWHEIDGLASRGYEVADNLLLSDRAHVIFPWHLRKTGLLDQCSTGESIGTTMRRGYRTLLSRQSGPLLGDSPGRHVPDGFRQRVEADRQARASGCWPGWGRGNAPDVASRQPRFSSNMPTTPEQLAAPRDRHHGVTCWMAVDQGKRLLFEGAPDELLDIDHGTSRFVTSSNSSGVGVPGGSGVPGAHMNKVSGREGLHDAGRRRPFPTDRIPTRSATTSADAATNTARSRGGRGAAVGSTPWPRATPPGSAAWTVGGDVAGRVRRACRN